MNAGGDGGFFVAGRDEDGDLGEGPGFEGWWGRVESQVREEDAGGDGSGDKCGDGEGQEHGLVCVGRPHVGVD